MQGNNTGNPGSEQGAPGLKRGFNDDDLARVNGDGGDQDPSLVPVPAGQPTVKSAGRDYGPIMPRQSSWVPISAAGFSRR
jgi:hypothetical protein